MRSGFSAAGVGFLHAASAATAQDVVEVLGRLHGPLHRPAGGLGGRCGRIRSDAVPIQTPPVLPIPGRPAAARRGQNPRRAARVRREHDRLQLGERVHDVRAADPADAAVGPGAAAEREVCLPVVGRLVDVDPAGADAVGELEAGCEVGGEDRREQAVGRGVGQRDRLLERVDRDHRGDRSERLLDRHPGVGRNVGRGPSAASTATSGSRSARAPPVTTLAPRSTRVGDVLVHLRGDRLVVERAHRGRRRRTGRRAGSARSRAARAARRTRRGPRGARGSARRPCSSGPRTGSRRSASRRPRPRGRRRPSRRAARCRPSRAAPPCRRRACATSRPVAVEPMKATPSVPGLRAISSPTTGPGPGHEVEDARRQVGVGDALARARPRRPRSTAPASRRPRCRTRAPARSARPASCRASSTG